MIRGEDWAVSASPQLQFEYNTNVGLSSGEPIEDLILRPMADFSVVRPWSRFNSFRAAVGVGYDYYLLNPDFNRNMPYVTPGTTFELVVYVGEVRIMAYDRPSLQQTLGWRGGFGQDTDRVTLTDTPVFERFQNTAGVDVEWPVGPLTVSAGYSHENFMSITDSLDFLDRTTDGAKSAARMELSDRWTVGMEADASYTDYAGGPFPDHWRFRAGPTATWRISEYITADVGGGWSDVRASQDQDIGDTLPAYLRGSINHRLSAYVTQTVEGGFDNQFGYGAANRQSMYAGYTAQLKVVRNVALSVRARAEFFDEADRRFTYYMFGGSADYRLGERITATLMAEHLIRDEDFDGRTLSGTRVVVGLGYQF